MDYLALVGGEQREDLWVDEVQLSLDLVAAWVVHSRGVFIEHQVLSPRSKSVRGQQHLTASAPRYNWAHVHTSQQSPFFRALFTLCTTRRGCCPQGQEEAREPRTTHAPLHPLLVAAVPQHCLGGHVDHQGHLVFRNSLLVPGTHSKRKNICAPVHVLGIPSPLPLWCYQRCPLKLAEQGFSEHGPGSPKAQGSGHHLLTPPQSHTGQFLSSISNNTCRTFQEPKCFCTNPTELFMCRPGFQQPGKQQAPLLPRQTPGHIPALEVPEGKQARGCHKTPEVLPFLKASKCTTNPFLHLKLLNSAKEPRHQP